MTSKFLTRGRTLLGLSIGCAWLAGCGTLQEQVPAPQGAHTAQMTPVRNIIIGGGMRHCTSVARSGGAGSVQCAAAWDDIVRLDPAFSGLTRDDLLLSATAAPAFTYSVTSARLAALEALPARLMSAASITALRPQLLARLDARALPESEFAALIDSALAGKSEHGNAERAALRHVFVDRRRDEGKRRIEARSVQFMNDTASAEIYRTLVAAAAALAGGGRPKIALVTAAADNPFNDHDIYATALRSAGAEVIWLPLDGGLRRALAAGDCAHVPIDYSAYAELGSERRYDHMDQLFPDLAASQVAACKQPERYLDAVLAQVHGMFFSGGNQARILDSLLERHAKGEVSWPATQLRILRQRYESGKLVVAGTSAGDAVQAGGLWRGRAVPMLTGGGSLRALARGFDAAGPLTTEENDDAPTFERAGGLGVFSFGPLDSHFSQRAREGRLLRLVAETGMDYGFGVDENTALLVGHPDAAGATPMAVVGAGGVWVVDVRSAHKVARAGAPLHIDGALIHYLHAGDRMAISLEGALSVWLSSKRRLLAVDDAAPPVRGLDWTAAASSNVGALTRAMGESGARDGSSIAGGEPGPCSALALRRNADTQFRAATAGQLSYSNLAVGVHPCGSVGGVR